MSVLGFPRLLARPLLPLGARPAAAILRGAAGTVSPCVRARGIALGARPRPAPPIPGLLQQSRPQVAVRVRPRGSRRSEYERWDDQGPPGVGPDPGRGGGFGSRWNRMGWGKWLVVAWAGGTTVYYFTHQDRVPISGRKRFLSVTPEEEIFMARVSLQQVLQEYGSKIVPPNHPIHQFVAGVVKRLLPVTGLTDLEWEIRVIADPQQNAFVLPGGKIFVFTGILDVCPDADSLATVLGHEMAHTIARHSAEKLSYAQLFTWTLVAAHWILGIDLTWVQGLIYNFAVNLPRSRMVESEADYIGLQLMAQACFDPSKAVGVWQRFILLGQKQPPEFLSDHPSHESRIVTLQKWLPEAQMRSEQSDCHRTLDFLGAFGGAWGYEPRRGSHAPQKIIGFEDQVLDPSHLVRTDEAVREAYDSFSNGEGEGRRR